MTRTPLFPTRADRPPRPAWRWLAAAALCGAAAGQAGAAPLALQTCRLPGVPQDALCGTLSRPLDPAAPQGRLIALHVAVLPAMARNKHPDPIVFLAGGPGQSAIALAPQLARQFARSQNRRDLILVDQRGTGRSAPLDCGDDNPARPVRDSEPAVQLRELAACRARLQQQPHGDLRQYVTSIAMADLDAVRAALGVERVNLVGGSYGTRAALEYQRQFPQHVRRTVIDGVAPPDMVLPLSFGDDGHAALQAVFQACETDAACRDAVGPLRTRWDAWMAGLPRPVTVTHPLTGATEALTLTPEMVSSWVRLPLYVPSLTAALPHAMSEATQGRLSPLLGLVSSVGGGRRSMRLAMGQHLSVVCAEDGPLVSRAAAAADTPGRRFGRGVAELYVTACADWPRGAVPPAFYTVPPARTPVLVMSGGADPVTPPRHGERVTAALGAQARHVVVPGAGHGVMSLPCLRDVVHRFIDAPDDAQALAVDLRCASQVPRATVFRPVQATVPGAEAQKGDRP
jgi:pimeloyl-ACP methyl ester carboxylesterase